MGHSPWVPYHGQKMDLDNLCLTSSMVVCSVQGTTGTLAGKQDLEQLCGMTEIMVWAA